MPGRTGRWGLRLEGHPFDLADWQQHLRPPYDPSVGLIEKHVVLRWSGFEGFDAADEVQEAGAALLDQLNGAMAVCCHARRIQANGVVEFRADGTVHHTIIAAVGGVKARARGGAVGVVTSDGNPSPSSRLQPSRVQTWIETAERYEELADALVYYDRSEWFDIYKAIECLEDWVGGEVQLKKKNWGSDEQLKRTKRTANSLRHRRNGKHTPPEHPATLQEARQLLGMMIERAFEEAVSRGEG